jgi:LuxR family maltose regulon positive regulatory protein
VPRPRLHRVLDDGIADGFVLICAPAGFGKTHLVAEWCSAAQADDRNVAWVTLDEADRDPARFLRYVTAAVGSTPAGRKALRTLEPLPPFTPPDEQYLVTVAEAVGRLTSDVLLVLDDFDSVLGSPTESMFRQLLRYRPAHVRPVVLSRTEPELDQGRLQLGGTLRRLGAVDLAFTLSEAGDLLARMGVVLSDSELDRLHRYTEGWVAGLLVTAASLRSHPERARAIGEYAVGDPALREYLLGEVLDGQPPDVQDFMARTSVVDEVCADLAVALTGRADAEEVLGRLARSGLLDRPRGSDALWFRWHPMVAALLRSRLRGQPGDLQRSLHREAAGWLREAGHDVEAIRQAVEGGDVDTAAAVLGRCWLDLVLAGESEVLVELLAALEAVVHSHPHVAVASGLMLVRTDDVDEGLRRARCALRLAAALPPGERLEVKAMATVTRLYAATMTGRSTDLDAEAAAGRLLDDLTRSDLPLTHGRRTRRALLLYNLGAFETSRHRYAVARPHLDEALTEATFLDLGYLELSCRAELVEHHLQAGELDRGIELGTAVLDTAQVRGWQSYHGLTVAHVGLAGIAILRDDIDTALLHLSVARQIMRPVDRLSRIRASFLTVVATCARGRTQQASDELEHLRELAGEPDQPSWVPLLHTTARSRHDACLGVPEEGLALIDRQSWDGAGSSVIQPYPVVRADLLIRLGRPEAARDVLAGWVDRDHGWPVHVAALVTDSLAAEALGLHEEAVAVMARALEAAAPERVLYPFVWPGPQARPLVEELIASGTPDEEHAVRILTHMSPQTAATAGTAARSAVYVEPLSERELDVLVHLQGTLTNNEIAELLHVSVNTLRSHMKSINRKLGAANRRDAVRRARDLGIV